MLSLWARRRTKTLILSLLFVFFKIFLKGHMTNSRSTIQTNVFYFSLNLFQSYFDSLIPCFASLAPSALIFFSVSQYAGSENQSCCEDAETRVCVSVTVMLGWTRETPGIGE